MGTTSDIENGTHEVRTKPDRERERLTAALDAARQEIKHLRTELAAARTQSRHLSTIFERAPVAIFVKDLEGRYVDGNPTAASVLGKNIEELMDLTDEDLFGVVAAPEIRDIDQYVTTSNRPFRYEARRFTAEGERVFQTTKWPRLNETNDTIGIIAMSRDITDEKYAREYYALQSAISGVAAMESSGGNVWSLLAHAIRSAMTADLTIFWAQESGAPQPLHHSAVRPGFGEGLAATEPAEWIQEAFQSGRPLVRSTTEADDPRLRRAAKMGLFTVFTIPIHAPEGLAILECFTTERRTETRRFLENLTEASRRLSHFPA